MAGLDSIADVTTPGLVIWMTIAADARGTTYRQEFRPVPAIVSGASGTGPGRKSVPVFGLSREPIREANNPLSPGTPGSGDFRKKLRRPVQGRRNNDWDYRLARRPDGRLRNGSAMQFLG